MNFLKEGAGMNISIIDIVRVELRKMLKRKDFLSLIGILGIGILFSASILTDSYEGAVNQSALYWIVTQMLNSSILFIAPMLLAYCSVRTLAQEIENGSIRLLVERIPDRRRLYLAKSISLYIYSSLFFVVSIVIHGLVYFVIVSRNRIFANGSMLGENTNILLSILFCLYLSSFVLVPQVVLCFGIFFKPGIAIGIIFILIMLAHNSYKIPIAGMFSPWYYLINLANDVMNTTERIAMEPAFIIKNLMAQLGLCGMGSVISCLLGRNMLKKRDLS